MQRNFVESFRLCVVVLCDFGEILLAGFDSYFSFFLGGWVLWPFVWVLWDVWCGMLGVSFLGFLGFFNDKWLKSKLLKADTTR